MSQGIMVVTEQSETVFRKVSFEVLSEGRRLADQLNCQVTAVVMGSGVAPKAEALQSFIAAVRQLVKSSEVLGRSLHIDVVGYADPSGGPAFNLDISLKRAQAIAGRLIEAGVDARLVSTRGAGYRPAVKAGVNAAHRRVAFEVITSDRRSEQAGPASVE